MPDIPTTEPLKIRAGDTVKWKRALSDYPASDSWSLTYHLVKSGKQITVTAEADGAEHLVTIAATTSAAYPAGRYQWAARVSKAGEAYTIGDGVIEVLPDISAESNGFEWRTHCEQAIENIEALLLGKASKDNFSYSIAGRSLSKYSWDELRNMRAYYRNELLQLERKAGRAKPRQIVVTF